MYIDEKTVRTLKTINHEQWEAILKVAQQMVGKPDPKIFWETKKVEETQSNQDVLETRVRNAVKEMGVPPQILGYKYLQEAVILVCVDEKYIHNVTKVLYSEIANKFETTSSRVERAIEVAFNNGNPEEHEKVFKGIYSPLSGIPTNSYAIASLAEYVKIT